MGARESCYQAIDIRTGGSDMTATTEGLTRTVCEYVAASRYDDLPADVVEMA